MLAKSSAARCAEHPDQERKGGGAACAGDDYEDDGESQQRGQGDGMPDKREDREYHERCQTDEVEEKPGARERFPRHQNFPAKRGNLLLVGHSVTSGSDTRAGPALASSAMDPTVTPVSTTSGSTRTNSRWERIRIALLALISLPRFGEPARTMVMALRRGRVRRCGDVTRCCAVRSAPGRVALSSPGRLEDSGEGCARCFPWGGCRVWLPSPAFGCRVGNDGNGDEGANGGGSAVAEAHTARQERHRGTTVGSVAGAGAAHVGRLPVRHVERGLKR